MKKFPLECYVAINAQGELTGATVYAHYATEQPDPDADIREEGDPEPPPAYAKGERISTPIGVLPADDVAVEIDGYGPMKAADWLRISGAFLRGIVDADERKRKEGIVAQRKAMSAARAKAEQEQETRNGNTGQAAAPRSQDRPGT